MKRQEILELIPKYFEENLKPTHFDRNKDMVHYARRVFDQKEIVNLIDASLDFWLTEGRYSEEFSEKIAEYLNVENVYLTNSGSSSNLLAISALTSNKLGSRKITPGSEIITAAAGFPSTVTPILQNNCTPVFVDIDIPTYNVTPETISRAISRKTKAIFLAHTLGNPWEVENIKKIAQENNLWLIEDNCDAFGSQYDGIPTGTFGDISTISFYPAHHITTGEGGAVITNSDELGYIIKSFRDWGRDCYCNSGENNTCGKRFTQQFGTLPLGYDHKYVYSEIGYNFKMTDLQAAIGSAQIEKLYTFCEKRINHYNKYQAFFKQYEHHFILPQATAKATPAWFSYILTVRPDAPFTRNDLIIYLNQNRIETRNVFAGNMIRQPAFIDKPYRVSGDLDNTDLVMNNTFFLGVYPGLTEEMFDYVFETFNNFLKKIK